MMETLIDEAKRWWEKRGVIVEEPIWVESLNNFYFVLFPKTLGNKAVVLTPALWTMWVGVVDMHNHPENYWEVLGVVEAEFNEAGLCKIHPAKKWIDYCPVLLEEIAAQVVA